jgi:formate hydrogenlyase subunit 3/multisubunit Na+/H+ antiporter MnhD subunit
MTLSPLALVLGVVVGWTAVGAAGLLRPRDVNYAGRALFGVGALGALMLLIAAIWSLGQPAQEWVLPMGLPDLPLHVRLDPLAAFFLALIGASSVGISIYSAGYFRAGEGAAPGLMCLQYHTFLASMAMVVLANDAYTFMVAWETMALASYFLVTTQHRVAEIREAGFLYLLLAHVGAISILLCFGVLQGGSWQFTFDAMRAASLSPGWASVAFGLALFGFGAKAGLVPLHVWLPEAHPAAPSPVSAMMSGVMLNTAIYGLLRVSFDLLHLRLWWWGGLLLALGLVTALFGVVFASVQTDMKRLLAYSSIENMGLLFVGLGLTLIFSAFAMRPMAALALTATLYHVASHACFKSLLFLSTGCVLHATAERNLGKLGGLIRTMPWVGWLTLLGVLAGAGLPPLGGFVSEWLLLQSFLFTPGLPLPLLTMLIPVVAAVIALVAALAGYTMVKFFGVIFLGQPREEKLAHAHDAGRLERLGMLWLALGCVVLGLLPSAFIQLIDPVTQQLVGAGLGAKVGASGWLLAPNSREQASYGPVIFLLGILASFALAYLLVRRLYHGRLRRALPWACGFPWGNARMQDTAEGFGQPIRQIFEPFFRMQRELPSPFDTRPRYHVKVEDHFWRWLYLPVAGLATALARLVGLMQQGRISVYLLYSFMTLVATLLAVMQ